MEELEEIDTMYLEHSVGDPTTKEVNWPKPPTTGSNAFKPNPKYIPPTSKNRDDVILTFREYNDMLIKIYYLEHRNEHLHNINKHLGEEIQSLQKQLLNKKLRKVKCLCKLRGKC